MEGATGCGVCGTELGVKAGRLPRLASGDSWKRTVGSCKVLGGYGFDIPLNATVSLKFSPAGITAAWMYQHENGTCDIAINDLLTVDLGGPGRIRRGGGFIGGGFGLRGAVTGIAVASALNALTTRVEIITILCVMATAAELWVANTDVEPGVLRIELAPVFVWLRAVEARRSVATA